MSYSFELPDDFRSKASGDTAEYLTWIFKYLPLPDYMGYSPDFYLENVKLSLQSRKEMPWGRMVPEREFRHFVLPVRTNNEKLDEARALFYPELKKRVEGKGMKDAILEVNRWCRERVTYAPSDGRTSNPLSTMSQATGRCGEESTLLVAALRSLCIPARQVYTPRWAHTDDNHAWVEAWADGEWYFLGACEPEPVLNLAWFNDPASRGILMHTNVFGVYDGPEDVLMSHPLLTRINVTSHYAPVETLKVKVVDMKGKPVENANVRFCIYNYADFYPVVEHKTDKKGLAQIHAGIGDIPVWVSDGKRYGIGKGRPGAELKIVLDHEQGDEWEFEMDIVPPKGNGKKPVVTQEQRYENNKAIANADRLRREYISTFDTSDSLLILSRGNHKVIKNFREHAGDKADSILNTLCEKDLRDIPAEVLDDVFHWMLSPEGSCFMTCVAQQDEDIVNSLLNPRVDAEPLVPYRGFFSDWIPEDVRIASRINPDVWVNWIRDNIKVDKELNPNDLLMDPISVAKGFMADDFSRDIFFVASCRSMGIPSRLDPISGVPQYFILNSDDKEGSKWMDVNFNKEIHRDNGNSKGKLKLLFTPSVRNEDPEYYMSYSLIKLDDGVGTQLEFEAGVTASSMSADMPILDAGNYLLLSGRRLAGGEVLAKGKFFNIQPGKTSEVTLDLRHDETRLEVIGGLNSESIYHNPASKDDRSLLSTVGRGYYILGIIKPNSEPSAHILNELSALGTKVGEMGRKLIILFENNEDAQRFDSSLFPDLPEEVVFGIDKDGEIGKALKESLHLEPNSENVFVIADSFNRVVFVSEGYSIGLAGRLLDNVLNLNNQ